MRITLNIVGVLLVLFGAILFLQELPGNTLRAVDGSVWVIVGSLALLKANRGPRKR